MDLVVVTGATGRQGGAVARHLLASGRRVRALTRDPGSPAARELARLGAEVVRGDMGDLDSLRPVMHRADGVYSVQNHMISGLDAEIHQGRTVGDAALEAGVRHFVYGSAGTGRPGTGVGSWESKLVVQKHLEALGLPLTVLRPMAFMELMTDKGFYPPVTAWHLMPKLMGDDRALPWLCVDDLGAVAARVFAEPERFVGVELALASDVVSLRECRALWVEVFGRKPKRFPMPVWMFEKFVGKDLTAMWRWLRVNPTDVDPAGTWEVLPRAHTVRQWLAERRA
ncbi:MULTISPECIES: NmrA/HSCARG family protein [unclassified Saccharothrix]|uniref:NmrA/HSCARG family protein n=1 Tax=unclassified Saccharothrix TaxID=2593673 RepID=UPI00307D1BA6